MNDLCRAWTGSPRESPMPGTGWGEWSADANHDARSVRARTEHPLAVSTGRAACCVDALRISKCQDLMMPGRVLPRIFAHQSRAPTTSPPTPPSASQPVTTDCAAS